MPPYLDVFEWWNPEGFLKEFKMKKVIERRLGLTWFIRK